VVEAGSRQLSPSSPAGRWTWLWSAPRQRPVGRHHAALRRPARPGRGSGPPAVGRRTVGVGDLHGLSLVHVPRGLRPALGDVGCLPCRRGRTAPGEPGRRDGRRPRIRGRGPGAAVVPAIALPSDHRVTAVPFADPGIRRTVALAQRNDRAFGPPGAGPCGPAHRSHGLGAPAR